MADPGIVLAMLACLTSGLAAVAVAPRNRASIALLVAGMGTTASVLLTPFVARTSVTASGAVLVQLQNVAFLGSDLALTALLVLHPQGRIDRRWHGAALVGVAAVAVLTEVSLTVIAPRMSVDGSGPGGRTLPNPLAIPLLAPLEPVADVLWTATLAWPLVGAAVLVDRLRRAAAASRRGLIPLAAGFTLLTALLVVQLVAGIAGVELPEPGFTVAFQLALAAVPVVLLAGIARRTRGLDAELLASRSRLVSAEDRVRRGIERDLHDGVQQQLVAILSLTQLAQRQQRRSSGSETAVLDEVSQQVQAAIVDLRDLVSGIRPPVLQDAGVAAALAGRLESLPADVALDASGGRTGGWDGAVEAAAYFVGCEAVTNALKHASGAPVRIRVVETEVELLVEVTDGGPGIDPSWPRGRGLSGLQDRVESLGGTFAVGAAAAGGTRVAARFTPVGR